MKCPNLLFIATDHQRADSIGMVQAGIEATPHLNRLAGQGAVFGRAYTTCPLCVPARTALATGKYPTATGVVCNDWKGETAGDHKPMHQFLAEAGYEVGHVGVHHIRVSPSLQDRVPFSKWVSNPEYRQFMGQAGLDDRPADSNRFKRKITENQGGQPVPVSYSNTETAVWPHPEEYFLDSFFGQQAVEFIQQDRDQPFALFVYLWAPHPPLRVPEPYASLFDPEKLDLPPNVGPPARGEPPNRRLGIAAQLAEGISIDQWRKVWAAHLGLTRLADAVVGRILATLEEKGNSNDTLTIFTTDHGDHLGQHAMYQKMEMYEQAVRISLILRGLKTQPRTCDTPVSHLDLLPTLLDIIGIEKPGGLDGISLRPFLEDGVSLPDRPLFCQYSGNPVVGDIRRAVITRRHKYVYDPTDRPELYDLEVDSLEMENLADREKDLAEHLHDQCRDGSQARGDWVEF